MQDGGGGSDMRDGDPLEGSVEGGASVDAALAAFAVIAERQGAALSAARLAVRHGVDGPVATDRLVRIAEAEGFRARAAKLDFAHLAGLGEAYPVLLRLTDGSTLIAEGFVRNDRVEAVMVRDPAAPTAPMVAVDAVRLGALWDGETVFLRRRHDVTAEDRPFGLGWMAGMVLRERRLFRDVAIAALVLSVLTLVPPFLYMIVIDKVLVHHRTETLLATFGVVLVVLGFETVLGYLRRAMVATATQRIDARIQVQMFDRLVGLPIDFFDRTATGLVAYKLGEVRRIRGFLTGQLFTTLLDATTLVVLIPAMILLDATLAAFVIAVSLVMAVIVFLYIRPMAGAYQRVLETEHKKNAFLIEAIHGARTVKSLALETRKRREWDVRVAASVRAQTALQNLANQPQTLLAPLERLIYAGSLALGGWMAIHDDKAMFAGTLVAFTMIATRATQPIVQIAALMQQVQEVRGAVAQVASVVNVAPEPRRSGGARPEMSGEISFTDVRFFYPDARTPALDGVSFAIEPGTVVGIMGRSGSGKTTVTRLLQGLHQGYEGLVKFDGVELREIDLDHLRSKMGVVLQESFLFQGSIRDNILAAAPDAGVQAMIDAARLAGAEEFVERLPRSYDTPIEENGSNLSGGQRQRLAIARALVTDPPILVFDEATSALDPESEAIVNANLRRIAHGRTVIVISHRLTSLVDCDQILVMDKGRVIDAGRHGDLLARSDVYRHLWFQQNRHLSRDDADDHGHATAHARG
ncbi:toxin RTX-I translocation ATP-binding protein [Pleomorphomonas sp. SM30]|uniref:ATP-binding cassette subfamily B protein n=1 Tax=Oharaeibacter diazotrophicus TaxID=1920512 RepID=A0A4R6R6H1_9HYPH|nr:ATP-binding cassette subfamily B protein [Oharaeibacter diazotrophicus]BBE73781.1 toxin RTX-I translocation ATP-binding protein [Pleomorphomonas sp. SM30]